MYGYRARIGYCSPPFVTEVFCSEFYQMAPAGVTLMITTLAVTSLTSASTKEEMAESHAKSLEAAKAMARAGADVVVLGGNPINQSRGVENLDEICVTLAREIGTKVITSTHAQMQALRALGARKVATVQPFVPAINADHEAAMRKLGVEPAGMVACVATRWRISVACLASSLSRSHAKSSASIPKLIPFIIVVRIGRRPMR
jgi:maleate isomerase